jgi:hypothetical protein
MSTASAQNYMVSNLPPYSPNNVSYQALNISYPTGSGGTDFVCLTADSTNGLLVDGIPVGSGGGGSVFTTVTIGNTSEPVVLSNPVAGQLSLGTCNSLLASSGLSINTSTANLNLSSAKTVCNSNLSAPTVTIGSTTTPISLSNPTANQLSLGTCNSLLASSGLNINTGNNDLTLTTTGISANINLNFSDNVNFTNSYDNGYIEYTGVSEQNFNQSLTTHVTGTNSTIVTGYNSVNSGTSTLTTTGSNNMVGGSISLNTTGDSPVISLQSLTGEINSKAGTCNIKSVGGSIFIANLIDPDTEEFGQIIISSVNTTNSNNTIITIEAHCLDGSASVNLNGDNINFITNGSIQFVYYDGTSNSNLFAINNTTAKFDIPVQAPTPATGDNSTNVATTAWVNAAIAAALAAL